MFLTDGFPASAVYDEQDGDFQFTRVPKKTKTSVEPEPEPAPVRKKLVGRPKKSAAKKRTSPVPEQETPPAATTNRTTRSRSSLTANGAQEDEPAVPKTRPARGRKPRSPMDQSDETEETTQTKSKPVRRPPAPPPRTEPREAPHETNRDPDQSIESISESKQIALPLSDTPIINRNKELRKKGGQRRSSLGTRGRRASSLIESGHSAIPHREVNPAEFYKHIEADGLSEPRRMKQLLTWCGERALAEKPPHGSTNSNAVLGGVYFQRQYLHLLN